MGTTPASVNVDEPTNKIYVSNSASNTVTMIDGVTYATTTVNVGTQPINVAINPVTNRIYIANHGSNNVSVIAGPNIPTTTVLMTAPNPSNVGQLVTMTATVTAQNGSLPTGTVVFKSNGVQIGSAMLNNSGVAVLNYSGIERRHRQHDRDVSGLSDAGSQHLQHGLQVVKPVGSMTSVTSSPNPSTFGQAVTITATVSPSGPPTPTGTVSFTSNGTAISGCTAVPLSSSMAVCMTSCWR